MLAWTAVVSSNAMINVKNAMVLVGFFALERPRAQIIIARCHGE